jgi:hypothetical protein
MDDEGRDFAEWMAQVDSELESMIGLVSADLPDCLWRDWFEDGTSVKEAALQALEDAEF